MAIEDIKNYIEQNKDKHPVDVLLNQLRASGYPESEIQAYLSGREAAHLQVQAPVQSQISLLGKIGRWIVGFILGAIIIGIALILAFVFIGWSYNIGVPVSPFFSIIAIFVVASLILFFFYWRYRKRSPYIARGFLTAVIGNILLAVFALYLISIFMGFAYIYRAPQDPMSRSLYFYEKRADGSYWLKAYLEDTKNTALRYDQNPGDQYYDVSN